VTGSPRRFHCLLSLLKLQDLFHWAFLSLLMHWPWAKILWSICISCMFAVLAEPVCQCTDKYPETTQQIWWMLQIIINPFTFYKLNYFVAWWYWCVYIYVYTWTSNTHESQWMCSMMILFLNFAIRIHWILYFNGLDFCITSTDFLQGIYKFIVDWVLLLPGHLGIVSSYEVSDISICCYTGEKWVTSFKTVDSFQYSDSIQYPF
jgi:hypothetical protein